MAETALVAQTVPSYIPLDKSAALRTIAEIESKKLKEYLFGNFEAKMLKIGALRKTHTIVAVFATAILSSICFLSTQAFSAPPANGPDHGKHTHFVPNSQAFWDFSKNWTTNYGPAYRDTDLQGSNFLPCTGQYALCFESGPEPLPCTPSSDGRFANCKCVVKTGINFVLMTAILNEKVYKRRSHSAGPLVRDVQLLTALPFVRPCRTAP